MKIVFVRTRHEYGSYRDYWSLVELAGFDTCYTEQMDLREKHFYIVSPINGDFRPHIDHCRKNVPGSMPGEKRAKIAWWNLERPDTSGSEPLTGVVDDVLKYVDIAWTSDRYYETLDPRQQHVVMGSDARLCKNFERRSIAYDYTHQSYVWGRREETYIRLRHDGFREGPNAWFEERDAILKSSRVLVNIHQTPAPIGEPIRFAMGAAYKIPLISETLAGGYPLVAGVDYIEEPLERVGAAVRRSREMSAEELARLGENLFQRLCVEWTFGRGVEEGVAESLRRLA